MSSKFDECMQVANGHILNEYGVAATVTPAAGGNDVETVVLQSPERGERRGDEQGQYDVRECDISVPVADVEVGVGAVITIGTDAWKVFDPPEIESGMAEVKCRIDTPINKRAEDSVHKLP